MSDLIERLARGLSNLTGLGRVTADTEETPATPTLQLALPGSVLRSDMPYLQEYGFASRPVPGSDAVMTFIGGDRSRGVVVATGDQRNRPKDLKPGEVCLYHPKTKSRIWLKEDGSIALIPANGKVTLEGSLTVTEDVTAKEVTASEISLTKHKHSGVRSGPDQSGPPQSS
ncbi:phage baseplate assembly protein [Asaia astilbis]|uniref:phage baseplate assembly protein n=1 Tax=Asaia astilbis TaxID=610244 RepID=UPI0004720F20|nr:phage baseplate assembly protein [Asaia astilbis]